MECKSSERFPGWIHGYQVDKITIRVSSVWSCLVIHTDPDNMNTSKNTLNESDFTNSTDSIVGDDTMIKYYEAFHAYRKKKATIDVHDLLYAMRTAGGNPTESELQDIKNKLDDGCGEITFDDFCQAMRETLQDGGDEESFYKETFRTFGKDNDGCIPPEEMRFVFQFLGV